jgi:hypothetical protein
MNLFSVLVASVSVDRSICRVAVKLPVTVIILAAWLVLFTYMRTPNPFPVKKFNWPDSNLQPLDSHRRKTRFSIKFFLLSKPLFLKSSEQLTSIGIRSPVARRALESAEFPIRSTLLCSASCALLWSLKRSGTSIGGKTRSDLELAASRSVALKLPIIRFGTLGFEANRRARDLSNAILGRSSSDSDRGV